MDEFAWLDRMIGDVGKEFELRDTDLLAGASVCSLCQAGSYSTGSGEWMWTGAKRSRESFLSVERLDGVLC